MHIDVKNKLFWFIFVELLCGFGASVALGGLWSGHRGDNRVPDVPKVPEVPDVPSSIDFSGPISRSIRQIGITDHKPDPLATRITKTSTNATNKLELSVVHDQRVLQEVKGRSNGTIYQLMRVVFDSVGRGRRNGNDEKTSHILIAVLLPGALIPLIFRCQLYTFGKNLNKPGMLTLMIITLVMYLVGGIAILTGSHGSDGTAQAIFAIVAGAILIVDLVFFMLNK